MSYNIVKNEEEILSHWTDKDCFKKSLEQSKGNPEFVFHDGPPFATGSPHYGHLLAGTIKDVICRRKHQQGYHVPRRLGWDTHGLPIEMEIEKIHGIKTSKDIERIGIKKYNSLCREIVMKCADEWGTIIPRMGRWIDFENDYKTMDKTFMEGVWNVFSRLWDKGMVYNGYKVMPYSPNCRTVLSNFEAKSNYKDVHDPNIIVKFPLIGHPDTYFLVFTTTPWTLPSNKALCVNEEGSYVYIRTDNETYIVSEHFKIKGEIVGRLRGKEIIGKTYEAPYKNKTSNLLKVVSDDYVDMKSGTGVVHIAPDFGEDDYRICLSKGIVAKNEVLADCIDELCCFKTNIEYEDVKVAFLDVRGRFVKDCDKMIIQNLKDRYILYSNKSAIHSYPFCWRSNSPLIYRAVPSWFIDVESIIDKMVANNKEINWSPSNIGTGKFHNWLLQARDWCISRSRFWANPIPIWISEDGTQKICVSSAKHLSELSGVDNIEDLHRDNIDFITIPDPRGENYPAMKRIEEVFDCWMDSSCMPFATSDNYQFKQADFIAEGQDQCRGWYYSLLILSTALEDKPAFKNVIVNGLILAEDGQKMSKSKKNYPAVIDLINEYGADAIRLYLISSPAANGHDLKFKSKDLKNIINDIHLPLNSSLKYVKQYTESGLKDIGPYNVMDEWIINETKCFMQNISDELDNYRLYNVVKYTTTLIDNLTNWYIKLNRNNHNTHIVVIDVLLSIAYALAPCSPYISEKIYMELKLLKGFDKESIHYYVNPLVCLPDTLEIDSEIKIMKKNIEMLRSVRLNIKRPISLSIKKAYVYDLGPDLAIRKYISDELNIDELLDVTEDMVKRILIINQRSLGIKFKGEANKIKKYIQANKENSELLEAYKNNTLEVLGHKLDKEDIIIKCSLLSNMASISEGNFIVVADETIDEEMTKRSLIYEIKREIKNLRKKSGYKSYETANIKAEEISYKNIDQTILDELKVILV